MSRYRKIEVQLWGNARFRRLSKIPESGQGLLLYLMTGPHTGPIPGLFRAGRVALADELGWSPKGFDKAFRELFDQGFAEADFDARVIWLPDAIKINKPESPNVVRAWGKEFILLPDCHLKSKAFGILKGYADDLSEAFAKAFREAFPEAFQKALAEGTAIPLPKAKAYQEQEQEQDRYPSQERSSWDQGDSREVVSDRGSALSPDGHALPDDPAGWDDDAPFGRALS